MTGGTGSGLEFPSSVPDSLEGLRDFQRDTATYVHDRLFADGPLATSRFLVADEVGLGKTLVARGVIGQAIEHLKAKGDKRIDIVYVASNSVIASQNVRKLAPKGVDIQPHTGRLSLLPYTIGELDAGEVNLIALTPQTSLDLRSQGGTFPERAAAFAALRALWGGQRLKGEGIALIFAGGIERQSGMSPGQRLRARAHQFARLSNSAVGLFREAIRAVDAKRVGEGLLDLDSELHALAPHFLKSKKHQSEYKPRRARLIREIREAMSWTGVQLLQPDLVILDEFQRFKNLLSEVDEGWTSQIARALFNYEHKGFRRKTRVLLLSATPYVMHTTTAEAAAGSDVHYKDFVDTYRFLAAGLPDADPEAQEVALRERLARVRDSILDADRTGADPVREATKAVSDQLTKVMVRTDRLAATIDHDGMLKTFSDSVGVPTPESLGQYIDAARVATLVKSRSGTGSVDVMDYWKSAPYTISFLGGHQYVISRAIKAQIQEAARGGELAAMLKTSRAVLPWKGVQRYREIDPANGRMRQLWADMFDSHAHTLLWMPPSCPYYEFGGRFDAPSARRLTKRLVFSAWAVVPTVVSTLTSFEAERLLHNQARAAGAPVSDYDKKARHSPHLRLEAGTQSMPALIFQIPSQTLAEVGDALRIRAALGEEGVTWERLVEHVRVDIAARLSGLIPAQRVSAASPIAGVAGWYTLAPMLLDALESGGNDYVRSELSDSADWPAALAGAWLAANDSEAAAPARYLKKVGEWFDNLTFEDGDIGPDRSEYGPSDLGVPPVPDDLEDVLARAALAGPPSALFRALSRHFPELPIEVRVRESARAARGFVSLFNSWEATRVIDATGADGEFWRKALDYCAEGNLQAVVDEYVTALIEWRGYDRESDRGDALRQTATDLADAMSLRTSVYDVMRPVTGGIATQSMRGRFAVRYGKTTAEDTSEQRAEAVSLSFNSPFWPFVLTTTSVGQEGLDFHLYCHAVSHWNLPSNPVDLEQREGRVHRYKGHAVRKNVARVVGVPTGNGEPWREIFDRADDMTVGERPNQLVPYWVFAPADVDPDDLAKIERHLPITPFSREASRIAPLLASVAYYRLAFGQPRQEELVKHVLNKIQDPALQAELATIRVDLRPPRLAD